MLLDEQAGNAVDVESEVVTTLAVYFFGFHSRAIFWALAISAGVICLARLSRRIAALWPPPGRGSRKVEPHVGLNVILRHAQA